MLIELVAALTILAIVTSSVLVVMNQCIEATIDGRNRATAFRIARDNMEYLLTRSSVKESAEFGSYELNPDIEWETVVETVNNPADSAMWVQAVCLASYTDSEGERQYIELIHWLTNLTAAQQKQILDQKRREAEFMEEYDQNPFGDDPEGLMKYANALAASDEYERAIIVLEEFIDEYPDDELVPWAIRKIEEWGEGSTQPWTDVPGDRDLPYDTRLPDNKRPYVDSEPSRDEEPTTKPNQRPNDTRPENLPPEIDWDTVPDELKPLLQNL